MGNVQARLSIDKRTESAFKDAGTRQFVEQMLQQDIANDPFPDMGFKDKAFVLMNIISQSSINIPYQEATGLEKYLGKAVDVIYGGMTYFGHVVLLVEIDDHKCSVRFK